MTGDPKLAANLPEIVAGADLPIPQHVYCPSWGYPPCRVTREIAAPPAGG
jgi:hypothetical protein